MEPPPGPCASPRGPARSYAVSRRLESCRPWGRLPQAQASVPQTVRPRPLHGESKPPCPITSRQILCVPRGRALSVTTGQPVHSQLQGAHARPGLAAPHPPRACHSTCARRPAPALPELPSSAADGPPPAASSGGPGPPPCTSSPAAISARGRGRAASPSELSPGAVQLLEGHVLRAPPSPLPRAPTTSLSGPVRSCSCPYWVRCPQGWLCPWQPGLMGSPGPSH